MEVFVAVIASLMLLYVDAACPSAWHAHRNSCYFLSTSEKATWPEAVEYCRVIGGYLVDINNAEEDHFVRGLATLTGTFIVWVGAQDFEQEGVWKSSHTQQRLQYIGAWGRNQPDQGRGGNCLALWGGSRYQWADHGCKERDLFICERPAF